MSRIVDIEPVLKTLEHVVSKGFRNKLGHPLSAELVIADIKSLPTVSQWIPVSERLPEEDGRYLCSVGIGNSRLCVIYGFATHLYAVSMIDFGGNIDAGFYDHDSEYGYADVTEFVTAWMPLPEPYMEGTDG